MHLIVAPLARQVHAHAGDDRGLVAQAHIREVQGIGGEEVRGLGEVAVSLHQLARPHHVTVRVLHADVKPCKQNALIESRKCECSQSL